jgi:hypothetical protein
MTFDEMVDKVTIIFPGAQIEEDHYGQIIIYTDMMESTDGLNVIPFVDKER